MRDFVNFGVKLCALQRRISFDVGGRRVGSDSRSLLGDLARGFSRWTRRRKRWRVDEWWGFKWRRTRRRKILNSFERVVQYCGTDEGKRHRLGVFGRGRKGERVDRFDDDDFDSSFFTLVRRVSSTFHPIG